MDRLEEIERLLVPGRPWPGWMTDFERTIARLKAAEAENAQNEKRFQRLTDAMARWGWNHCTSEKELIEQIDYNIQSLEAAEAVVEAARTYRGDSAKDAKRVNMRRLGEALAAYDKLKGGDA